jgi:hypothetical protein
MPSIYKAYGHFYHLKIVSLGGSGKHGRFTAIFPVNQSSKELKKRIA